MLMRKAAGAVMITGFWLGLLIESEGCMFCALPHKRIRDRFERLCGEYMTLTGSANCSKYTETDLVKFQLDERLVNMVTEKVHRVLRVIEINQTLNDLPNFWNWLYEKKLPELTQQSMCAPKCRYSTTVINCSLCLEVKVNCWKMKTCWPNHACYRQRWTHRINRVLNFTLKVYGPWLHSQCQVATVTTVSRGKDRSGILKVILVHKPGQKTEPEHRLLTLKYSMKLVVLWQQNSARLENLKMTDSCWLSHRRT